MRELKDNVGKIQLLFNLFRGCWPVFAPTSGFTGRYAI